MTVDEQIVTGLVNNNLSFVTTVPCKQLAGVIEGIDKSDEIFHIPSN